MKEHLVSIISPCFNGEKYLRVFLDSVLNQYYDDIELIMVDDGSRDGTAAIIEAYQELFSKRGYKLQYYYQDNAGQAAAINEGLRHINGQFLMWVDSDDFMMPESVSDKVAYLLAHSNIDYVISQEAVVKYGKEDEILRITKRMHDGSANDDIFADMIRGRNVVFGPGTVMVRTEKLRSVIPDLYIYPSKEGQNWQLMLPITYALKCGYIDEVHLKCIVYPDSHSRKKRTVDEYIDRNDGIRTLICKTLEKIPQIKDVDLQCWTRFIIEKYARANLYLSFDMHDKARAKKYKEMLKDSGNISIKSTYLWYMIRKIKLKLEG